jgi:hypothetical protein
LHLARPVQVAWIVQTASGVRILEAETAKVGRTRVGVEQAKGERSLVPIGAVAVAVLGRDSQSLKPRAANEAGVCERRCPETSKGFGIGGIRILADPLRAAEGDVEAAEVGVLAVRQLQQDLQFGEMEQLETLQMRELPQREHGFLGGSGGREDAELADPLGVKDEAEAPTDQLEAESILQRPQLRLNASVDGAADGRLDGRDTGGNARADDLVGQDGQSLGLGETRTLAGAEHGGL